MVAYDDPPAAKAAIEWFNGMYSLWLASVGFLEEGFCIICEH